MNLKNIYKNLDFRLLKIEDNELILKLLSIRNEDNVRNFMFNNKIIDKNHHVQWIRSNIKNGNRLFYLVFFKEILSGCVVLSNISHDKKNADWAFYISTNSMRGIGAVVEYKFLNKIFCDKEYNEIFCEVLDMNKSVLKLHKRFGFIDQKKNKKFIIRNDKQINITSLFLKRQKWLKEMKPIFDDMFI